MNTIDAAARFDLSQEEFLKLASEAGVNPGQITMQRVSGRGVLGGPRGPSATAVNWTDAQLNKIGIFRRERRERGMHAERSIESFADAATRDARADQLERNGYRVQRKVVVGRHALHAELVKHAQGEFYLIDKIAKKAWKSNTTSRQGGSWVDATSAPDDAISYPSKRAAEKDKQAYNTGGTVMSYDEVVAFFGV